MSTIENRPAVPPVGFSQCEPVNYPYQQGPLSSATSSGPTAGVIDELLRRLSYEADTGSGSSGSWRDLMRDSASQLASLKAENERLKEQLADEQVSLRCSISYHEIEERAQTAEARATSAEAALASAVKEWERWARPFDRGDGGQNLISFDLLSDEFACRQDRAASALSAIRAEFPEIKP